MKKILIALGLCSVIAAPIFATAGESDSENNNRIKTIDIKTRTNGVETVYSYYYNEFDSIIFYKNKTYDMLRVHTKVPGLMRSSTNPPMLSFERTSFEGLEFTYLDPNEIATPCIYGFIWYDNSAYLAWMPIDDAVQYELKYATISRIESMDEGFSWDDEAPFVESMTLGTDSSYIVIPNLDYHKAYRFSLRAVSATGYKTPWSAAVGYKHEPMELTTGFRYTTPKIIKSVAERTATTVKLDFDLAYDRDAYIPFCANEIESHFHINDSKFLVDKIRVKNLETNEKSYMDVSPTMLAAGEVTISDLIEGSTYEIGFMDSSIEPEVDAMYNTITVRLSTKKNLYEYISSLGDDYSIFRDHVLRNFADIFDQGNSRWLYRNENYEYVYDSVFVYNDPRYAANGFYFDSDALKSTLLLPSNDVIKAAMEDAHARLGNWGYERSDSALYNWIAEVCLFDKKYSLEQMTSREPDDIYSVLGRQFRTNAQELDGTVTELLNGVVYPISKLHIPDNVLIYRIKDYYKNYAVCTAEQINEYFKVENMVYKRIYDAVPFWTPLEGVWPMIENRCLFYGCGELGENSNFKIDFTPIKVVKDETGKETVMPYLIPPGTYRLAFGSQQGQNLTVTPTVLVDGNAVATAEPVLLGVSTTYHYDRGTTLPDRYPEGYDPNEVRMLSGNTKASNYDTDGGLLIQEVVIPDDGMGTPKPIVIRFEGNWESVTQLNLHHWCLRPTADMY